MPKKGGVRTPMERTFIDHMARTGDPVYAATRAGYSNPETNGRRLGRHKVLTADIRRAQAMRLLELGDIALGTIETVLSDPRASERAKLAAAALVLKYNQPSDQDAPKGVSEMTPAEMDTRILEIRAILDAEDVSDEPEADAATAGVESAVRDEAPVPSSDTGAPKLSIMD